MIPTLLLFVFLGCAFVYGQATNELRRLEALRIDHEISKLPLELRPPGLGKAKRIYMRFAPGGEELEKFCNESGHADAYSRANRKLFGAIAVCFACIFGILKLGDPSKS